MKNIIRRDFLNGALLGVGSGLLQTPAPAQDKSGNPTSPVDGWTGYGGVGDYANSNGNTWPVMSAAHKLRDGAYRSARADVIDTGEHFDVIIVGGGLSGLGAAYYLARETGGKKRCLVLENHPMFGGECKQNEFEVNGYRLIAPQGSNNFAVPPEGSGTEMDRIFTDLNIPRKYDFQPWNDSLKPLRFPFDNYANLDGLNDTQVDIGYYFDRTSGAEKPTWIRNIFANGLEGTPFPPEVRSDLLKWRNTTGATEEQKRFLDTITYKDYLERVMGYRPEVTKFIEPFTGLITGVSPDAVAARVGHQFVEPTDAHLGISFPGGNTTFARHLVRYLIPDCMAGDLNFERVLNSNVRFETLDKPGNATRIRLGATVLAVEHDRAGASTDGVAATYEKDGKLYRAKANAAIVASGGWISKYVLRDSPEDIRSAYAKFVYAPALIVNVALTNWRFLYKLRAPACRWFNDGFGFSCNIRRSMIAGEYSPPLNPDKPTVLTFYLGLYTPGRTAHEQGVLGRSKLLSTSYADYERQVRQQMSILFSDAGFSPETDIAGIVLNRWGHARMVQPPGFFYGRDGKPSPREVVQKGYGRIAIGHSELNGHQNATGAIAQGKRAVEQVFVYLE
jgi:spermidine dehydrogenase